MRHLLLATREENARDMQHSRQLLDEENWQGLARSLHRLAGATQIVGAAEAENHCRSLEQYCENTAAPDKEQVAQKLHLTLSALQRLNQAIDDFTAE
ncbi:Hpt domain-containing protein [Serratia marcescens]|uniref:Hpt domain-containing protein n=1 Tax=Serratia marcescens TaxID=615 RepID=UPI003FA79D7C